MHELVGDPRVNAPLEEATMGRNLVWALGIGAGIALSAAPAAAQVDIGVWTPNGGGRVVVGAPPVYYPPAVVYPEPVYVYPEPVYVARPRVYVVERDYYYYRPHPGRGLARGHYKHGKYAPAYAYRSYPQRVYRADPYRRVYYNDRRDDRRGDRRGRR